MDIRKKALVSAAIFSSVAFTSYPAYAKKIEPITSYQGASETALLERSFQGNDVYQIGAGIADVTGEVAEANMFGYADTEQISEGVQQRLHARAFVIKHENKELLMVVLDTGKVSQALHQAFLKKLNAKYAKRFTKDNVMLTATHTHAAPGGFSHYALYNLTTRGFQKSTFDAILNGALRAANRAIKTQSEGKLEFGTSRLENSGIQRSHTAYIRNPEAADNPTETETLMQVLKFVKNGTDFASINWFAVHPTSLSSGNKLISGDNKGYASWYWEKQRGMNYLTGEGYIAAFANSNPGDVSPNLDLKPGKGPTDDEWKNAQIMGSRQAKAAIATATPIKVEGGIDYRQNYVDFSNTYIDGRFTVDGKPHKTCTAAYKTAFAAGSSEDGGGGEDLVASNIVAEGRANPLIQALGYITSLPSKSEIACHETDQVAIIMGKFKPYPLTPEVLPSQLIRLGNLAIISVPSEFTTIAGQRLRKQISARLNVPYENVIFAGYSNAYAGYITTPEEYAQQDYEGASNHFGPHSLEAWAQNLDKLAIALVDDRFVEPGPTPRDLTHAQFSLAPGVIYDNAPIHAEFGDVETQPKLTYKTGDTAKAVFWSAHPKSSLAYELEIDAKDRRKMEPYTMAIQYFDGSKWQNVATDNDWNTLNKWKRIALSYSQAILTWDIPADVKPGVYRFYHKGAYKNGWTGKHIPFEGYSNSFNIGL